jgi:hypothetical protein
MPKLDLSDDEHADADRNIRPRITPAALDGGLGAR